MRDYSMDSDAFTLTDSCFEHYIKLVHSTTGITLEKNRKPMLVGRFKNRISQLGLNSYEAYLDYVLHHNEEHEVFTNLITTNETYFYRTPMIWEFFSEKFLTNWDVNKTLRVWSAAASTGEEAHTIGVFCEHFKQSNPSFNYFIFGTDISPEVVKKATAGVYNGRSIKRFRESKPQLFDTYMCQCEAGYRVNPAIKKHITFENHHLFNALKQAKKFDFIFLRNVLIYFNQEDQEIVLANMHHHLSDEGYLVIGESESIGRLQTDFVAEKPLIYRSRFSNQEQVA